MIDTIIQDKINTLPENVKHAVEQFDWATEILHIAQDHQLQIDTIESFRRETLLVIVGLTDAADYEKNLVSHMHISDELAEILVSDANEHIFRPLQKIAFTHDRENDKEDREILNHNEVKDLMNEHGIELVDEFKAEEKPKNELQELADSLFNETKASVSYPQTVIHNSTRNPESDYKNLDSRFRGNDKVIHRNDKVVRGNDKVIRGNNKVDLGERDRVNLHQNTKEKSEHTSIEYNEPIESSDLAGIYEHRINTDILNQTKPEKILQGETLIKKPKEAKKNIEHRLLNKTHISKTASLDVSPTKAELIKENNEFLKHIGAS